MGTFPAWPQSPGQGTPSGSNPSALASVHSAAGTSAASAPHRRFFATCSPDAAPMTSFAQVYSSIYGMRAYGSKR